MTCDTWRGVGARRDWFLSNSAGGAGWCARHTWNSLGGDQGCPPPWYCSDANAVVAKLRAAGELRTYNLDNIPKGAIVVYEYGSYGHMCLSDGPRSIVTTDSSKGANTTGVENYRYPEKWGAKNGGIPTGWADYYAGVRFTVGDGEDDEMTPEQEEQLIRKIAKRVVQALGDFDFNGDPQEGKGPNPDNGAQRLRKIWDQGVKNNPNLG